MPMPATRMPEDAVTGDDIRFRPYMNRKAAARSVAPIASDGRFVSMVGISVLPGLVMRSVTDCRVVDFGLRRSAAGLEHRQHAMGHGKAAGGIARTQQDRKESDGLFQHRG